MPRPDQLCECGHERQEHRAPGGAVIPTHPFIEMRGNKCATCLQERGDPAHDYPGPFTTVLGQPGPCSALEPCEECGGSGEREVERGGDGWGGRCAGVEDVPVVCGACDGKRFEACDCRGFKATLSAESPRSLELTREDLRELILACRAHARGWALDGRLRAEVRANYRRIALRLEEESERQDREEGFCPACSLASSECRCPVAEATEAMEG